MIQQITNYLDLDIALAYAYSPSGLVITNFTRETESQEYGACQFKLNNKRIIFRIAKITPHKIGQFVTCWKRLDSGPITPYDTSDQFDFFVINVRQNLNLGQFVFPKSVLLKHGIISQNSESGKRGFRVYPPWDPPNNKQAEKTQKWQLNYFFEISQDKPIDTSMVQKLYNLGSWDE